MVVGAALAGAIVFGVLSLVSGSGSDNKALEARKAPPPAAEAPYDPNSVIAPTLATAPRDPNAPVQLTGEQVPAIGPDGQPITPYGSAGGQQGRGVSEAERRANEARELRDNARRSTLIAYNGDQGVRRAIGDVDSAGTGNAQGYAGTAPSRTNLDNLQPTSPIRSPTTTTTGHRHHLLTTVAILPLY